MWPNIIKILSIYFFTFILIKGQNLSNNTANSTVAPNTNSTSTAATTTQLITTTSVPFSYSNDTYTFLDPVSKTYCILVQAKIVANILYTELNDTLNFAVAVPPPNTTRVSGSCNSALADSSQLIILSWQPENTTHTFSLQLSFQAAPENSSEAGRGGYSLAQVSLTFDGSLVKDEIGLRSALMPVKDVSVAARNDSYYRCATGLTTGPVPAVDNSNSTGGGNFTVSVHFTQLSLQAFRLADDFEFTGGKIYCRGDLSGSDVVPIVVGCILALLVVCVIVAYFIGRRKAHVGYQPI